MSGDGASWSKTGSLRRRTSMDRASGGSELFQLMKPAGLDERELLSVDYTAAQKLSWQQHKEKELLTRLEKRAAVDPHGLPKSESMLRRLADGARQRISGSGSLRISGEDGAGGAPDRPSAARSSSNGKAGVGGAAAAPKRRQLSAVAEMPDAGLEEELEALGKAPLFGTGGNTNGSSGGAQAPPPQAPGKGAHGGRDAPVDTMLLLDTEDRLDGRAAHAAHGKSAAGLLLSSGTTGLTTTHTGSSGLNTLVLPPVDVDGKLYIGAADDGAGHPHPHQHHEQQQQQPGVPDGPAKQGDGEPPAPAGKAGSAGPSPGGSKSGSEAGALPLRPSQQLKLQQQAAMDDNDIDAYGDLSQYGPFRRLCIRITTNADFELIIMLTILTNCVTLSLYNPMEPETSTWNRQLWWADVALNTVYTIEMVLRIVALGPPYVVTYLRRPWNCFDAFMVAVGYTAFIPPELVDGNTNGLRALRALRALRPLRTITRFESLRSVVVCFMEAVPLLMAVAVVLLTFLFMYAVAAVQMFTAVYHNVCMGPDPYDAHIMVNEVEIRGKVDDLDMFGCSGELNPSPERFWRSLRQCPTNMTCITTSASTAINTAGFDNVGLSMMTDFQCLTLTSWGYIMYRTMDNTSPFSSIYFITLIIFGAYFVVHLFLAVLKVKFAKAQTVFQIKALQNPKKSKQNTIAAMFSKARSKISEAASRMSSNDNMSKQLSLIGSQLSRNSSRSSRGSVGSTSREHSATAVANKGSAQPRPVAESLEPRPPDHWPRPAAAAAAPGPVAEAAEPAMGKPKKKKRLGGVKFAGDAVGGSDDDDYAPPVLPSQPSGTAGAAPGSPRMAKAGGKRSPQEPGTRRSSADGAPHPPMAAWQPPKQAGSGHGKNGDGSAEDADKTGFERWMPTNGQAVPIAPDAMAVAMLSVQEFDEIVAGQPWGKRTNMRIRFRLRKVVEHQLFDNIFLLLILVSTVLLAMEYDGMSDGYMLALWDANIVLTSFFVLEVVMKLWALGFFEYFTDGFNVFDFLIVCVALTEIILAAIVGLGALRSMRALRILRALRVLRLLKVFKYISSLRRIGEVLINSFSSFFAIVILLGLFWLVFTIMGLHVFGGIDLPVGRNYPNFNTFINAMLSTFNILNLENWNQQMYAVIDATNWGSSAYYIFWIVIGKYTLLALFLAVMLEAFEAKYDPSGLGAGGMGSRASGMLSGLRSKLSSLANSVASSRRESGSLERVESLPVTRGPQQGKLSDSPVPKSGPAGAFATKAAQDLVDDVREGSLITSAVVATPVTPFPPSSSAPAHGFASPRKPPAGSALASAPSPPPPEADVPTPVSPFAADQQDAAPSPASQGAAAAANGQRHYVMTDSAKAWHGGAATSHAEAAKAQTPAAGPVGEGLEDDAADHLLDGAAPSASLSPSPPTAGAPALHAATASSSSPRPPAPELMGPDPHMSPPDMLLGGTTSAARRSSIAHDSITSIPTDFNINGHVQQQAGSPHPGYTSVSPSGVQSVTVLTPEPALGPFSPHPPASGLPAQPSTGGIGRFGGRPMSGSTPRRASVQARDSALMETSALVITGSSPATTTPTTLQAPGAGTTAGQASGPEPPDAALTGRSLQQGQGAVGGSVRRRSIDRWLEALPTVPAPPPDDGNKGFVELGCIVAADFEEYANPSSGNLNEALNISRSFRAPKAPPPPATPAEAGAPLAPAAPLTLGNVQQHTRLTHEEEEAVGGGEAASERGSSVAGNKNAGASEGVSRQGTQDAGRSPSRQHSRAAAPEVAGREDGQATVEPAKAAAVGGGGLPRVRSVRIEAGKKAPQGAAAGGGDEDDPVPRRSEAGDALFFESAAIKRAETDATEEDDEDDDPKQKQQSGQPQSGDAAGKPKPKKRRKKKTPEQLFKEKQAQRNGAIMIEGSGKSFWYFDEDHPVRVWVYDRITTKTYDYIMFALIILNCIQLAIENPYIDSQSTLGQVLNWCDVAFTIIFGIEVVAKSFAFTFRLYIKDITNQVDFAIVVVSVLVLALEAITTNAQVATALRCLRAIKPLRMLTRSAGMRMVFKSVMLSMAAMAHVSLVCILFFLIFAILGTQLFMGLFWTCNDGTVAGQAECVGNYTVVTDHGNVTVEREWSNVFPNFDNVGSSLLICFITATLNGYTDTMIQAMAAPQSKGDQPVRNQNPGAFFWFAGFVFVCAFTLINLYVGVIFSQFSRIRLMSTTGSAFLTNEQHEWAELAKMVFKLKPNEKAELPSNWFRRVAHRLSINSTFEFLMIGVVLANMVCLAMKHWDMSNELNTALNQANYFFVAVFIMEVVLKVMALGFRMYWADGWNRFDVLLVALAILDLAASAIQANFLRALRVLRMQRLLRAFRTVQFVRLAKVMQDIRSLFTTLLTAMPAFGNVGSLIGLIFFMYAYIGVYVFGTLQWNVGINEHANFRNFLSATLVLLRVATGDNWSNILTDCMPQPNCDRSMYNCGSYVAIPYFLSFVLIVSVILLNLFTAVIVETFEKTHEQEEWKLSPEALEEFVQLWSEYDDGSNSILPRHLEELLLRIEPPLGLGSMADSKDVLRFVYDLDIPLINGRVPFHHTIYELVKRVSQSAMPEGALKEQIDRLVEKFCETMTNGDALNFRAAVSVGRVQRKWQARTRAAKLMRKKEWRRARAQAPDYSKVCEDRAHLIAAFDLLKLAEKAIFQSLDVPGGVQYAPRWRFNPMLLPCADDFNRAESTGSKLMKRMAVVLRGNKVAPASGPDSHFTTPRAHGTDGGASSQDRERPTTLLNRLNTLLSGLGGGASSNGAASDGLRRGGTNLTDKATPRSNRSVPLRAGSRFGAEAFGAGASSRPSANRPSEKRAPGRASSRAGADAFEVQPSRVSFAGKTQVQTQRPSSAGTRPPNGAVEALRAGAAAPSSRGGSHGQLVSSVLRSRSDRIPKDKSPLAAMDLEPRVSHK